MEPWAWLRHLAEMESGWRVQSLRDHSATMLEWLVAIQREGQGRVTAGPLAPLPGLSLRPLPEFPGVNQDFAAHYGPESDDSGLVARNTAALIRAAALAEWAWAYREDAGPLDTIVLDGGPHRDCAAAAEATVRWLLVAVFDGDEAARTPASRYDHSPLQRMDRAVEVVEAGFGASLESMIA